MSTIISPPAVAPAVAPPPPAAPVLYRLSVAQYHAMAAHGILTPEDRVELIHGLLVEKMTKKPPHSACTELTREALERVLPAGWHVRSQEPITFSASEPEPDLCVARGGRRDYLRRHPESGDVGLVVEVADSSLDTDRTVKRGLYAREGVPVYWIVNLIENRLEVHTGPSGPAEQPDYADRQVLGPADSVGVLLDGREVGRIAVRDLLP